MLTGTCHCGALRIEIPEAPAFLTNCNCSICRRLGTLWAYFPAGAVVVHGHPQHTDEYIQGDRTLRLLRCKTCGCVSHWEPLVRREDSRVGVNMRNFEPALLQGARLELLDGATTWTSVPADELVVAKRRVNRPWHEAHPMPAKPSLEQRVAWHRAHALACACRPVPEPILAMIAAQQPAP
ncbi:MAG: hypothetical protein HZC37_26675 [Burkholderiales bacterium]|nr:hypothetical protein [Burkholderiales bacterium]